MVVRRRRRGRLFVCGESGRVEYAGVVSHLCVFFFSSRRRHTRFDCDWSSDVCSSDLAVHSIATSRGAIRPARARATKVPNGWSWPVRASHRLPPHETGRPVVRFKCNPTPSSGKDGDERSRSRWAASVQPGAFTSTETEDTTPVSCASSTPRLTPADKPKSSALTMRRRASGIAASPVVPADLYQVSQHLDGVRGEPHGAGLVVVPTVHRRLRHLEAVFPGEG